MITTSHIARRAVSASCIVLTLSQWIMRTLMVVQDEVTIDLLTPLRWLLPRNVVWTAQEAIKTLDYGLLTLTISHVYQTWSFPERVVFVPLRFPRDQLLAELERRRKSREEGRRRTVALTARDATPPGPGAAVGWRFGHARECHMVTSEL